MANSYFQFKQFTIHQDRCAMKVTTDACLFGAWWRKKSESGVGGQELLDIGTGTGLWLILAQNILKRIFAIEIDKDARARAILIILWKDQMNTGSDVKGFFSKNLISLSAALFL
jgi:tRNA1Val (adenine37-N6)-methyltransferase